MGAAFEWRGELTVLATEDFEILLIYPYGEHVFSLSFSKEHRLTQETLPCRDYRKIAVSETAPGISRPRLGTQIFPEQAPPVFPDFN